MVLMARTSNACAPGAVRGLQALAHLARLRQRQRRAARADADASLLARADLPMLGGAGHRFARLCPRPGAGANDAPWMRPQTTRETLVLGIETSCDETAAAVVARAADGRGRILSNVVRAQWEQHRRYGGVVPEIAARAHVECLDEIIAEALREAGVGFGRSRRAWRSRPGPG